MKPPSVCSNLRLLGWVGLLTGLGMALLPTAALAQAGLRESLEQLDRNQNGEIDPEEITPLARPYLERIAKSQRISLERSNGIDRWQESARTYYALTNGVSGREVRPERQGTIKPFGPERDKPMVPEFGLAEIKYPYTEDDLEEADRTLRRSDRNRDGYIDRAEARRADWTHRDPFKEDYDNDNRLNRLELGQRYARRRMLSGAADELVRKSRRTGSGVRSSDREEQRDEDDSRWWRRGGSRYVLTASVLGRFDANRNGRLDASETHNLGIPVGRIDADRDGELSRDELQAFLFELQEQVGDDSEGLPSWFFELDTNRDKQVAMAEFATVWTDEKVEEFSMLDLNGDGLLTTAEAAQANSVTGGSYRNDQAEVLPPRKTVISEIVVDDDYRIADLNVQLSITHTYAGYLDGYLTGPDGQRIELFTEVGRNDDHFDQTVFDDQSRYPITKARPPFKGSFQPESTVKRQPGLSQFNGQSVKGVWQLVISGTRSDRFGMLHSWALDVKPMTAAYSDPASQSGTEPAESEVQPQ